MFRYFYILLLILLMSLGCDSSKGGDKVSRVLTILKEKTSCPAVYKVFSGFSLCVSKITQSDDEIVLSMIPQTTQKILEILFYKDGRIRSDEFIRAVFCDSVSRSLGISDDTINNKRYLGLIQSIIYEEYDGYFKNSSFAFRLASSISVRITTDIKGLEYIHIYSFNQRINKSSICAIAKSI